MDRSAKHTHGGSPTEAARSAPRSGLPAASLAGDSNAGTDTVTHRVLCKMGACEPSCGMIAEVRGGVLAAMRPDPDHPISRGYACIKGMQVPAYQNDPDRLLFPERRTATGWEKLEWAQATGDIGRRLRAIRDRHGPGSIATYWGNAADTTGILLANSFCHAFGSANSFNVLSLEYTDRGAVALRMFGDENLILQPDADHARYALLLGTNPLVTQGMTLLQRRPRIGGDLRGIRRRGGKIVVVDPRRTETARIADEHVAIRPGTDLFLLLGMLRCIVVEGLADREFLARHTRGMERLSGVLEGIDPDLPARVTDIAREVIERMAREFAGADAAFATSRVGVQTAPNTTLTEWAIQTLNAITGNIDRPGGVYFNPGFIDVPALIEKFGRRRNPAPSRIGGYPQIFGGPPAAVFADDVLSEDPDRIRALVVVAGNPVITFPDTEKMERALRRLELLVTVDIYRSDTGAFAHYNLPAATVYEKGLFHFMTSNFERSPFAEWRSKIVEPRGQARSEWRTFRDISRAAGVPFLNDPLVAALDRGLSWFGRGFEESHLYRFLLAGKGGLKRMQHAPYGIDGGEIRWGDFLERRLATVDGKIDLAPADLLAGLADVVAQPPLSRPRFPFLLVSGARRAASFNSWTHNLPELAETLKGNHATMHPDDAHDLGLRDGGLVRIETETAGITIGLRCSTDIRRGVVAVHQFWGHHYDSSTRTSRRTPGVNVNLLHDSGDLDRFSGMPVFNARHCRCSPVED